MRGYVRRRGNLWYLWIDEGKDESGKRKQRSYSRDGNGRPMPTKESAELEARRLLRQKDVGTYKPPSSDNVESFLVDWLKTVRPNIAPRT